MEKALFNDFREHEDMISVDEIEMVIFNKTAKGMKSEMTKTKAGKIIKILKGTVKSPMICSNEHLDESMNLSDSAGIAAVKVGCSQMNKNFLLEDFAQDKSIFTRPLSKECCLSARMDDCLLVGLGMLSIVKLETLNQKTIARRKLGRPRTTSPIHTFLKKIEKEMNRENLLENYLKEGHGKNFYQMFAHQIIRESDGIEHLAIIRVFRKDANNNVLGAIAYHPGYEIETLGSNEMENHEEFVASKDLAHDIIISYDNSNFKQFIANRNNGIGKECRESTETISYPHHCKCRVKAKIKIVKKNNVSKGRKF